MKQRKYCDKLIENYKSVIVLEHQFGWPIFFNSFKTVLFECPTFFMTYFVCETYMFVFLKVQENLCD